MQHWPVEKQAPIFQQAATSWTCPRLATSLAFAVLQKGRAFDDAMLRCGLDTTLRFTLCSRDPLLLVCGQT